MPYTSNNSCLICDACLLVVVSSGGSCPWAAAPTRFCDLFFFRIFYSVNIFYVIVHTLFTNAPVYVAEKTNFPISERAT